MQSWRHGKKKLRDYHVPGEASAMMCAKLAALVCNHMRAVFRAHEYCARTRDPPPGSGNESATEDDVM